MLQPKCAKCNGSGERPAYSIRGRFIGNTPCPYCRGTGEKVQHPPQPRVRPAEGRRQ